MIRATRVIAAANVVGEADDAIDLIFDQRHRRRIVMTSNSGREFLLDLPQAIAIADGDGLELEDSSIIVVRAKAETVAEITPRDAQHYAQIAWHLGNRHLPTEILDGCLRIHDDHVIVDMVRKLGATVEILQAPFQPEGGAYGNAHEH